MRLCATLCYAGRVLRSCLVFTLLSPLLVASGSVHAQAPSDPAPTPELTEVGRTGSLVPVARLLATGGVGGEIADPVCRDGQTLAPTDIARNDVWRRHSDRTETLLVDTGGFLSRHGVARFAARRDPAALGELMRGLGFRAMAFSEADLGDTRALVLDRVRALREAGVRTLATNLRCDASARALCDALVTGDDGVPITRIADQAVALLAYVDPTASARVGPDRMDGLRLEPLTAAVRNGVRAARARGADLVVVMIDSGYGAEAAARVVSTMAELEAADKPDLVFAAGAGAELLFARPASFRPAVVAAPTRSAVDVRVRRNEAGRLDILAQPAEAGEVPSPFLRFMERIGARYCEELGADLAGGRIDPDVGGEMDARAMVDLTAGVMRDAVAADVALLNVHAIDERWRLRGSHLSASDVNIAIQYDEPLMVADVPGTWIRNFARSNPEGRDLRALGVEITNPFAANEKIKVNGRLLDTDAIYRVVTIRFLAAGGDHGLIGQDAEWDTTEHTLRRVVLDHLEVERDADPRSALVDPWDRLEWTFRVGADLTFAGSAVRDPGGYQEGPLQNANQTQFGLNLNLALNALSRQAAWENTLTSTYTLAATAETDGFDEGADQVLYRTNGQYRGFRARRDELYVPDLVLEGLLRTELTPQAERDDHFLNLRFTAGLQWRLHLKVKTKLLAGVEVLDAADAALRQVLPGVGAQLLIDPWLLMREGLRKLTLGLTFDYFLSGPGGRNRHLVQGTFDLDLRLGRYVGLVANVTMYGLAEREMPFSFALQTTLAFRMSFVGRHVMR